MNRNHADTKRTYTSPHLRVGELHVRESLMDPSFEPEDSDDVEFDVRQQSSSANLWDDEW